MFVVVLIIQFSLNCAGVGRKTISKPKKQAAGCSSLQSSNRSWKMNATNPCRAHARRQWLPACSGSGSGSGGGGISGSGRGAAAAAAASPARNRRRGPQPCRAVAHDLTATLLEQVTTFALRARLKEARSVAAEISCDAGSLLSGRVNSVAVRGEGWRSPLGLTAQRLEASVGAAGLDYAKVLTTGQIALTNVPTGTCRVVFSEPDFGNFLTHPLVAKAAAQAVRGAPFAFDRDSVRLEAPSPARRAGAVFFTGACRADGLRYQVELLPVERGASVGAGVQAIAAALGAGGGGGGGANAVGDALTRFFNTLTVDLDGVELRLMSMALLPATGFAGALLDLRLSLTVRSFPPLHVKF